MSSKKLCKTIVVRILFCMIVLAGIAMVLIRNSEISDEERLYCERLLPDIGLGLETMTYSIEEMHCENAWIDAIVYIKLRVSAVDSKRIMDRIASNHKFNGGLSDLQFPTWWVPKSSDLHYVFHKDSRTGSLFIVVDIDRKDDIAFVYIAVIPA